ncbi:molecular chaperone [Frankia sp. CcI49]|uniref:toprim domain-containing protein n=1 Tax=Frankia sp. CcI49 TaxID=1745382 RepID=UPI0009760024|nr:toprim domain-containing protein [Frankia sp. CcI49]ONH60476.1 molecular chaperone [Frankia sp. CcI49]
MAPFDRDAILDATDIAALASEKCGTPQGSGRRARWHCPNPAHPDEHPSMGIYQNRRGQWRWKCLACGEGGTAIDLIMITEGCTVFEALHNLADRTGLRHAAHPAAAHRAVRSARGIHAQERTAPAPSEPEAKASPTARGSRNRDLETATAVDPAVAALAAEAEELLWRPIGRGALRYLHDRGFTDEILCANGVGFDPGPNQLPRPDGLPRSGPGIVFPVRDPVHHSVTYYQVRYLNPKAWRRYDQPTSARAPNPRLARLATAGPPNPGIAVICEGFPDALTAAQNDLTAIALLGTAHASSTGAPDLAQRLISELPDTTFVICFDDDTAKGTGKLDAGQAAAARLADELAQHDTLVLNIQPPTGTNDLNSWWQKDPNTVKNTLRSIASDFSCKFPSLDWSPASSIPST